MTATRVAIYTRISDEKQHDGASLETQLTASRRFVESQPDWVQLYELEDVETGLSAARESYQQLLELVRRRAIDIVVVWRLDRFGRDDGELMARYKDLARANVRLVSATEGQQSPFLQKLMFLLANEESRRISDRVRPNMRSRAESGLWQGRTPLGYRMDPARKGYLVIDAGEAEIVKGLFERAAGGGATWNNLSRWASAQGLRRREEAAWCAPITVKRIIRNPIYMGKVRWNVVNSSKLEVDRPERREEAEWVLVDGRHDPIVTPEAWNAAQEAMDARSGPNYGREVAYLLTGLVRCGVCGLAMNGHVYGGNRKKHPEWSRQWAYQCRQAGHPTKGGKGMEKLVVDAIRAFPLDPGALDSAKRLLSGMRPQGEHVEERDRLEGRLKRATALLLDGTLSREVYRAERAEIEAQIASIDIRDTALATWRAETEQAERALEYVVGLLGGLAETIEHGTPEKRRAMISYFVSCVRVHRRAPPEIVWHPWAARLLTASLCAPQRS